MDSAFKEKYNRNSTILDENYEVTGWIAIYHCVQPFLVSWIVFLSMKCCKAREGSVKAGYEKDPLWWAANTALCCFPNLAFIGSLLPIPAFANLYRFYLYVRSHHARSQPDFRTKIVSIEEEIREHEALGKL